MDQRVAPAAWRLAVANADLCPVTRLRPGWTLQAASQYAPSIREAARTLYGLDGDLPGVSAVAPDSPAAEAGLATGDLILAVGDQDLASNRPAHDASYDGLEANADILTAALQQGVVRLRVRRSGVERWVTLRPVRACAYETQVELDDTARSRADGRHVFISSGFLSILKSEDALALVLAHELGHNVLQHRTVPDLTGEPGSQNSAIRMRKGLSGSAEADADQVAVWLLARAHYDLPASLGAFDDYEAANPGARFPQFNLGGAYASAPARRRALAPVIAEVEARRARGQPLIP